MTHRLASLVAASVVTVLVGPGCGGGGGGGGGGSTLTGSVTPSVTPAGTSGTNQSAVLPGGIVAESSAVVGESVPAQTATTVLPGGTTVEVRHGFLPTVDGIAPSGSG